MYIFCDFDDVLFYTRKFNYVFKKVFVDCGIDSELFDLTYDKARERQGIKCYSYKRHLDILRDEYHVDVQKIEEKMHILGLRMHDFVFEDSDAFCRELVKEGHQLFLVTFGSPELQMRKVEGSRLRRYAHDAVIGEINKEDAVRDLFDRYGEQVSVFVDDREEHIRAVKKAFPQITTVLMRRPEGRYHDYATGWVDYTAVSCDDISKIIEDVEKMSKT